MANPEKRHGNGRRKGNLDVSYEMVSAERERKRERERKAPNLSIERTDERRIGGCTFLRGNANVLPPFFSLWL